MRIVDVDAFIKPREEWLKEELKKNHSEDFLRGYLEGAKVLLFELKNEMFAPTVDVSQLNMDEEEEAND